MITILKNNKKDYETLTKLLIENQNKQITISKDARITNINNIIYEMFLLTIEHEHYYITSKLYNTLIKNEIIKEY